MTLEPGPESGTGSGVEPAAGPAADPSVTPGRSSRRQRLGTIVKIVFGLAVLGFGIYFFASRWHEIRPVLARANWGWLIAALVFAGIGLSSSAFMLRSLMEMTSRHRLPAPAAARLFFVSQLGKYLPGSIWPVVVVSQMGRRHGIDGDVAATAGVLALFLSLVTGGALGIVVTVAGAASGSGTGLWWLLLLLPVVVLMALPQVVFRMINVGLKVLRRKPIEFDQAARSHYFAACGFSLLTWTLLGLQCWAIFIALGADPLPSLLGAVGGFALAYQAGTLFVPAPAGAGVREAVLGLTLSGTLPDSPGFQHSAAVAAVVLLSRVILTVLDFVFAGASMLLDRRSPLGRTSTDDALA